MLQGLSGNLWPIHLKPYQDELLSSWLVRLAHAHGLKLQTFCNLVFGRDRNIWNRDIDKLAPDWLVDHLSQATGTSVNDVKLTTLKSYEGLLYEHHQPNGNTRWITPLGIYHRIHHHPGLQYCSMCLANDEDPYFRKYWRLAFYTECHIHHILLHDRCPNCKFPINFHRGEMGMRSVIAPISFNYCSFCNYDLRLSPIHRVEINDWKTTISFRTLLDFHDMGWSFIDNLSLNYSHQLMDVLRHLCVIMSSSKRTRCLLPFVAKQLGMDLLNQGKMSSKTFEKYDVKERHALVMCAVWLLLDWPDRFIDSCRKNNLTKAYVSQDFFDAPLWFYSVLDQYLNISIYSPTNEEINSARHLLLSSGQKAGIKHVSQLLGLKPMKKRGQSFC